MLALVVINLLFWAWTQGYLRAVGLGPKVVSEPERLQEQVVPEALQIKPAASS
ncbi:MAG: hypothetical protein ACOVNN_04035 [Limnohabitans sp.]